VIGNTEREKDGDFSEPACVYGHRGKYLGKRELGTGSRQFTQITLLG
jgi:hypothetical protein